MFHTPQQLHKFTHPQISGAFIKKDASDKNILILEMWADAKHKNIDAHIAQILLDLEDLKKEAELQYGAFERVDIRPH